MELRFFCAARCGVWGGLRYFDVWAPEIATHYGEVFWTSQGNQALPDHIVQRFAGKVMAITGYEVDQVTHSGPQPGSTTKPGGPLGGFSCYPSCDTNGEDKSVPIYNAYNHHYFSWLTGSDSQFFDRKEAGFPPQRLPNPTNTGFATKPGTAHKMPTNIVFKENPGGEFRKSYHGYPSGYAQLLHSPEQWVVGLPLVFFHPDSPYVLNLLNLPLVFFHPDSPYVLNLHSV